MPIARLLFGLLVLSMATGQLLSFPAFLDAIHSYRVAGEGVTLGVAIALVAGEVFSGAGLLTGLPRLRQIAGRVGVGLAVGWAALATQAAARGLEIANCGCFGRFFAQRLSWLVLLQDAYFVMLAYLAMRSALRDGVVGLPAERTTAADSDRR